MLNKNQAKALFRKAFRNDIVVLSVLVFVFSAVFAYFSELRFIDFFTSNWDLGINEQMLWSNTHGYLLFETGDFIFSGGSIHSFLQIHSTYIAIPVSWIYFFLPYSTTLFVIQSLAISLSSVPLYLIGKRRGITRDFLFVILTAYLLCFGVTSALLYDYHWESFIPLEFLSMFYLLSIRRYTYGLVPLLAGCLTLEVFPFLAIGLILYLAVDTFGLKCFKVWKIYRDGQWRILIVYAGLTILLYLILRSLQYYVIPDLLAVHSSGQANSLSSSFTFLLIPHFQANMVYPVLYWLLLYASFAFVPILYPKHLIMQIPWIYSTLFIYNGFATYFGNQYALIAVPPMAIGFVYAYGDLTKKAPFENRPTITLPLLACMIVLALSALLFSRIFLNPPNVFTTLGLIAFLLFLMAASTIFQPKLKVKRNSRLRHTFRIPAERKRSALYLGLCAIVIFNLSMSPLNLVNTNATPMPGYSFTYNLNPAYKYMDSIASLIQKNQTVLASDNLFPFVANNPKAYSLLWFSPPPSYVFYPFNSTNLPQFVLFDTSQLEMLPPYLAGVVFNSSIYGIRMFIYDLNYPGSIYLVERGFSGNPIFHYSSAFGQTQYYYGNKLNIGKSGSIINDQSAKFGKAIVSVGAQNPEGNGANIWFGPYSTFVPGEYAVTISLEGFLLNVSAKGNPPILYMNSNSFGTAFYYSAYIHAKQLSQNQWTTFTFTINITEPYPSTEFRGYLIYSNGAPVGQVSLNYIEVNLIHLNQLYQVT